MILSGGGARVSWLAMDVHLSFKELVKFPHHFFLGVADFKLCRVELYRVGLAAGFLKVKLVQVSAASSPASIHQFLVVICSHLARADSPLGVAHVRLLSFTVTTVAAFLVVRVHPIYINYCLPWRDCCLHL